MCVYIYIYVHNVFHRPYPVFSSILYVHVSEMLCTFQRCCARVRDVVHVSQQLCTLHRSCEGFTEVVQVSQAPYIIMFVFNCIGATKHVLQIYIYIYNYLYICIHISDGWELHCCLLKKMPFGVIFCNDTRPSSPWTSAHFQRRGRNAQLDAAGQSWEVLPWYP